MRADQTVGGGATDKIPPSDQPEILGPDTFRQSLKGYGNRIARFRFRRFRYATLSIRAKAQIFRAIAHEESRKRYEDGDTTRQNQRRRSPAGVGDEGRHRWQKDELTGRICRGQETNDKSHPRAEPAAGNVSSQIGANDAGGQPDDDTPQQHKVDSKGEGDRRP